MHRPLTSSSLFYMLCGPRHIKRIVFFGLGLACLISFLIVKTPPSTRADYFERVLQRMQPTPPPSLSIPLRAGLSANMTLLAPTLYPTQSRKWITRNQNTTANLFQCIALDDCAQNQTKVVIIESHHFRMYLERGWSGGEGIWAASMIRAFENMGYSIMYSHGGPSTIQLYQIFEKLVVMVICESTGVLELVQWGLVRDAENPSGIPIWKIFAFAWWPGGEHPLGPRWTLNPEDYILLDKGLPHNSYVGYSIEAQCAQHPFIPHDERNDEAWILAKSISYFGADVRAWDPEVLDMAGEHARVSFFTGAGDPIAEIPVDPATVVMSSHVKNVGVLPQEEFFNRLSRTKVLIGMSNPVLSPTPYDALCLGVPFINPILDWDRSRPHDRSSWRTQHDMLKLSSPPYVYNVFKNDRDGFVQAIRDAMDHPIESYVPENMRIAAVEQRLGRIVEHDWREEAVKLMKTRKMSDPEQVRALALPSDQLTDEFTGMASADCSSDFGGKSTSTLRFFLNGSPIVLDGNSFDPDATLLDFIRSQGQGFTGTKLGADIHGPEKFSQHITLNACLAPIISVDGKHVITVEGVGSPENPHPIQERLWKLSGSQCGFCTPGIIMSLYALVRNAAYKGSLTAADIELDGVLDGNLCRCTGYKPILDAAKTFVGEYTGKLNSSADPVIPINFESANLDHSDCCTNPGPSDATAVGCGRADCCQLTGDASAEAATSPKFPRFKLKPYKVGTELIFPPSLAKTVASPLAFGSGSRKWLRPTTLAELLAIKAQYPDARLVGGSSEIQIEVKLKAAAYPVSVYVSDIVELQAPAVINAQGNFEFGANLSLAELEVACKRLCGELDSGLQGPIEAIKTQLRYFAGLQIRNAASVGGNIATASPISDLNPVWVATESYVIAASPDNEALELPLSTFFTGYRRTMLPRDGVLVKVVVPLNKSSDIEVVRAYKQAKRRDDDIAIVTACMVMRVSSGTITHARLAYGGMAPTVVSALKTQEYLVGKAFSQETFEAALDILSNEMHLPFDVPGGMASYRKTLALSFFFKFWTSVGEQTNVSAASDLDITSLIHRQLSSGRHDNSDPYAQEVVGKQEPHMSGLLQATGAAVYVDDMPKVGNELYGGLVLSSRAHAKIISVDASAALEMEGVVSWVSYQDLPNERANYWGGGPALDEVFFAVDEVQSHGQPIGMIVAQSKILAQKAARAVKIEYEDLPRILTIEEALEQGSFIPGYDRFIRRGQPVEESLAKCDHVLEGSTRLGGQEHFYLETTAVLVVPKLESGEMDVYLSTQNLAGAQRWVASATGVPRNRIVAHAKRLGGGFGGKETRTSHIAAITAVAAKKLRRPVRIMLDRQEDIMTSGQRHPCLSKWKVGFSKEGKLQALSADFWVNAGHSSDISGGVCDRALAHIENCYYIPDVDVRGKLCKTNTVSNTAFRGFGGPQGMLVAEHYIEAIADKLNLDIDHVRQINLYKEAEKTPYHQKVLDWHVPRMLGDCKRESRYEERKAAVDKFNAEHKWRKRGIVLVPTKFGLAFGVQAMNQGSALVHVYTDGSVLVAHGGVEMGQGLYTKCCQIAAQELRVPLTDVFTSESATSTVPNTVPTAASAGSDLNGYAVYNACAEINRRIEPYRQKLGPDASLAALANAAWGDRVSLSATGHHSTPDLGYEWNNPNETGNLFHYFTQGVCATEVEVDTLTGDHTVLRVDINMDVGKSLNPAIDYGQIEGAFIQGQGLCTIEESLWLNSGAIFTTGPGAYKIPGFSDIPQTFNVSLLKDAEWPNLGSIKASKGVGEPPLFLGCSVALAIRAALKSARADAGVAEMQEFRLPMTSERIRMACADFLVKKGSVRQEEGQKGFFVHI
ncbi:unnamed protein product [Mycena citricolor]|uniref:xanthine dehydrogenase n=1 Tax=Mycena citricolor TaxID=2018698 RepID=A0AAD2HHY4_9AGAR|nr:unnamed protein product [Mycena citricolor]